MRAVASGRVRMRSVTKFPLKMERDFVNRASSLPSMHVNHPRHPSHRAPQPSTSSHGHSHPPGHPSHPVHPSMTTGHHGVNRILSRNVNGTIAMTFQPSNASELQLYRVLQRANLLAYYDTFICQGGDDVQQLCEAGEEEFLEIMALVGMASKPLHVRRLQKALQEWVTNPVAFLATAMFLGPPPGFPPNGAPLPVAPFPGSAPNGFGATRPARDSSANHDKDSSQSTALAIMEKRETVSERETGASGNRRSPMNLSSPSATVASHSSPPSTHQGLSSSQNVRPSTSGTSSCHSSSSPSPKENMSSANLSMVLNSFQYDQASGNGNGLREGLITNEFGQPASPISLTPILMESQIQKLSESAEILVKSLPPLDPKLATNKKRISKELEIVMNMREDDERRLDEIRKYAAIYGRFDCKRKPEKPLTLHEVSVNEAAAQICRHIPALLTRRDELFPLARQVVRDSGYQYSKGHSRSQNYKRPFDESGLGSNSGDSEIEGPVGIKRIRNPDIDGRNFRSRSGSQDESNDSNDDSLYSYTSDTPSNGSQMHNVQEADDFSKLLPAKKSGDFGSASQLSRQLVHETLLDEGLRVAKDHQQASEGSVFSSP